MKRKVILLGIAASVGLSLGQLRAGHVEVNFDTDPRGILDIQSNLPSPPGNWRPTDGNPGGYLAITDAVGSQWSVIRFQDLEGGLIVKAFTFQVDVRMGNGTTERPADGMSINYARSNDPIFTDPTMWTGNVHGIDLGAEGGTSTGLAVCFDAWQGNPYPDTSDIEGVMVRVDDVTVLRYALPTRHGACEDPTSMQTGPWDGSGSYTNLCWQPLKVQLDEDGKLSVWWKNRLILDHAEVAFYPSSARIVVMGRTGGANQNQHIDNIILDTVPATDPTLIEGTGTAEQIRLVLADATGKQVNPSSITLKLDGQPVTAQVSKQGSLTTITYTTSYPNLLTPGTHSIEISFKDTANNSYTVTRDVLVQSYTLIDPKWKVTDVDTTKRGFLILPYQTTEGNPNRLAWTEEQLRGLHGPNLVDITTTGLPLSPDRKYIEWWDVIDFRNSSGGAGNFSIDYGYDMLGFGTNPNAPGTDNMTMEVLAYLYFPKAGMYTMGVASDDGFKVTSYYNAKDVFATWLGYFDGGRGVSDTIFRIYIPEPGYYPFRLLYEQGGGGAGLEWFTVKADGTKVLINDPVDPDAIKAYMYAATTRPYVSDVYPLPNATGVRNDQPIRVVIVDTGAPVDPQSVAMILNDQTVTPTIKSNPTTIELKPDGLWSSGSTNKVTLSWTHQGGLARSESWSFVAMTYVTLPLSVWSPADSVDTSKPGFLVKVFQVDPMGASSTMAHSVEWADALLAGALIQGTSRAVNIIDTTGFTQDGYYIETGVINYNQDYQSGSIGNFRPDQKVPGIPGLTGSTDNYAVEIKTYVVFPKAGFYVLGFNSDDGFRTTVGENPGRYMLEVVAPASAAGPLAAVPTINGLNGSFGGPLPWPPIEGEVVYVGTACDPITQNLTGKIALIDRGGCTFVQKCQNAQAAGALAVIIVNATAPNDFPFAMGGSAPDVTIPCMMVNNDTGNFLKNLIPGLRVSIGADPNLMLGQYYGGRGASDTLYGFVVPQAGVYPLRTVWWESGGGSNAEWFSVTPEGQKILLNDPNNPNALKCYRARTYVPQLPEISIARTAQGQIQIQFKGVLQSANEVTGPWTDVPGATSPYIVPTDQAPKKFYRARQP